MAIARTPDKRRQAPLNVVTGYAWLQDDEVFSSGICPGSRYARLGLHFLVQHEDGAPTTSGSSASPGCATNGLP